MELKSGGFHPDRIMQETFVLNVVTNRLRQTHVGTKQSGFVGLISVPPGVPWWGLGLCAVHRLLGVSGQHWYVETGAGDLACD